MAKNRDRERAISDARRRGVNIPVTDPKDEKGLRAIVANNSRLSYRDTRDLLMEYGASCGQASRLADGQPHSPGK